MNLIFNAVLIHTSYYGIIDSIIILFTFWSCVCSTLNGMVCDTVGVSLCSLLYSEGLEDVKLG